MKNQIVLSELNSNIVEIKTKVLNSLASYYTAEDVIKVLHAIEINAPTVEIPTRQQIIDDVLINEVLESIRMINKNVCREIGLADCNEDYVHYKNVEFDVYGTELSCRNVESDLSELEVKVEDLIAEAVVMVEEIFCQRFK